MNIPALSRLLSRFPFSRIDTVSLALGVAVAVGIIARSYEFHDWLRFSPDQARDALVAFEMTKGDIPLLGPVAGGTEFRLGPITHYFSYLSGILFGFSPSSLAFPDLLFSVLAIPLIFIMVSRMFGRKVGIVAAFLVALSGFMIRYGRFAWNPNSMPFFATLFVLAGQAFFDPDAKRRYLLAVLFGVALGVGVQLHTFLLVLLPLLTIAMLSFLSFRRALSSKMAGIALGVALVLNIPQFISEFQTGFANTNAFFDGASRETESARTYLERTGRDALCHVRANAFILAPFGHSDDCNRFVSTVKRKPWQDPVDSLHAILEILFTGGGIGLLGFFAWRETDARKRILFLSVLVYSVSMFLLIIPVANEIAMRYFLASAFVPFVLLGAWGAFLRDRGRVGWILFLVFAAGLLAANVAFLKREYDLFATGKVSDGDVAILGEIEPLSDFLSDRIDSGETAYLLGMRSYRKRFHKSFAYPLEREGKTLLRWEDEGFPEGDGPVFLVRKKTKSFDDATQIDGHPILDRVTSGRVSVFRLR